MEKPRWWKLFGEGLSQLSCPKSHEDSLAAQKMNFRSVFPYNEQHNPSAELSFLFLGSALCRRSTETLSINLTKVFHRFVLPPGAGAWVLGKGLGDPRESRNPLPPNSQGKLQHLEVTSIMVHSGLTCKHQTQLDILSRMARGGKAIPREEEAGAAD